MWFAYPNRRRTCADCRRWHYDPDTGVRLEHDTRSPWRGPVERGKRPDQVNLTPDCTRCPKVFPDSRTRVELPSVRFSFEPGTLACEFDDRFFAALELYRLCQAGMTPSDSELTWKILATVAAGEQEAKNVAYLRRGEWLAKRIAEAVQKGG